MHSNSSRHIFPLFAVCLSLVGCGPQFSTSYIYTPPKTESGRACTFNCESAQSLCEQRGEFEQERCEQRAEQDYQRCEDDIYYRKGREAKWHECSRDSCSADTERCAADYRRCYQTCGGKVGSETVCTANCDQLTPEQRKRLGRGH